MTGFAGDMPSNPPGDEPLLSAHGLPVSGGPAATPDLRSEPRGLVPQRPVQDAASTKPQLRTTTGTGLATLLGAVAIRKPARMKSRATASSFWSDVEMTIRSSYGQQYRTPTANTCKDNYNAAYKLFKQAKAARRRVTGAGDLGDVPQEDKTRDMLACEKANAMFTTAALQEMEKIFSVIDPIERSQARSAADAAEKASKKARKKAVGEEIRQFAVQSLKDRAPRARHSPSSDCDEDGDKASKPIDLANDNSGDGSDGEKKVAASNGKKKKTFTSAARANLHQQMADRAQQLIDQQQKEAASMAAFLAAKKESQEMAKKEREKARQEREERRILEREDKKRREDLWREEARRKEEADHRAERSAQNTLLMGALQQCRESNQQMAKVLQCMADKFF